MLQKDESEGISCKQDPSLNDVERTPDSNSLEHEEKVSTSTYSFYTLIKIPQNPFPFSLV